MFLFILRFHCWSCDQRYAGKMFCHNMLRLCSCLVNRTFSNSRKVMLDFYSREDNGSVHKILQHHAINGINSFGRMNPNSFETLHVSLFLNLVTSRYFVMG